MHKLYPSARYDFTISTDLLDYLSKNSGRELIKVIIAKIINLQAINSVSKEVSRNINYPSANGAIKIAIEIVAISTEQFLIKYLIKLSTNPINGNIRLDLKRLSTTAPPYLSS